MLIRAVHVLYNSRRKNQMGLNCPVTKKRNLYQYLAGMLTTENCTVEKLTSSMPADDVATAA